MLNLLTLLIFFLVFVGVYTVRAFSRKKLREEAIAERMQRLEQQIARECPALEEKSDESISIEAEGSSSRFPALGRLYYGTLKNIDSLGWSATLRLRLLVTAVLSLVFGAVVGRMTPAPLLVTLAGGAVVFVAVCLVVYQRAMSAHTAALGRALPEVIDSIARICRSGVPVQSSFVIAAEELRGPLSTELQALDQWLKLGVPLRQVLQESARRVPLREYRFFAVILMISQESGGRLAETLERLASTLRSRAELALKVQAKTSEARASIKIVAMLVPGVLAYMYMSAPQDFHFLFSDVAGIKVLCYSAASVLSGLGITWLMVRRIQ